MTKWLAAERCVAQTILVPERARCPAVLPEPLLWSAVLAVDDLTVAAVRDDEIAPTRALPIGVEPVAGRDFEIETTRLEPSLVLLAQHARHRIRPLCNPHPSLWQCHCTPSLIDPHAETGLAFLFPPCGTLGTAGFVIARCFKSQLDVLLVEYLPCRFHRLNVLVGWPRCALAILALVIRAVSAAF